MSKAYMDERRTLLSLSDIRLRYASSNKIILAIRYLITGSSVEQAFAPARREWLCVSIARRDSCSFAI